MKEYRRRKIQYHGTFVEFIAFAEAAFWYVLCLYCWDLIYLFGLNFFRGGLPHRGCLNDHHHHAWPEDSILPHHLPLTAQWHFNCHLLLWTLYMYSMEKVCHWWNATGHRRTNKPAQYIQRWQVYKHRCQRNWESPRHVHKHAPHKRSSCGVLF